MEITIIDVSGQMIIPQWSDKAFFEASTKTDSLALRMEAGMSLHTQAPSLAPLPGERGRGCGNIRRRTADQLILFIGRFLLPEEAPFPLSLVVAGKADKYTLRRHMYGHIHVHVHIP